MEFANRAAYEPLPEAPEDGLDIEREDREDAALLECEAPVDWAAVPNLDLFLTRVYRYWESKGFVVTLTARVLNLAALAFTLMVSAVLLLWVDYAGLQAECLRRDECNVWDVALRQRPLAGGLTLWNALSCVYLAIFCCYWVFALAHLALEARSLAEVRHFYATALGLSERAVRAATWPEVAARVVAAQRSVRLCIARDLTEHDIVARVMRRENYLIAMLNAGVLALNVPLLGLRRHVLLTKTLEWNLCILDPMFDAHFRVRPEFLRDSAALRRRLRAAAALNAAMSPFLLVFLLIHFFMKNAEAIYHQPSSIGARRWSPVARWRLREFNELPHFLWHRLNAGHDAAQRYCAQFPSHVVSHVARFVAFVAGSVAALLIALTLADERLLERDLAAGRQTVWWLALLGVVLAAARALIVERSTAAFDPGLALLEVAAHTHHLPRHWRGRAHTVEVQEEFQSLFRHRVALLAEELASVVLTPLLLWRTLPRCAEAVLEFVGRHTAHTEGVGDVCSLAAFDLSRHGNGRYGSPCTAPKGARSQQGKMEKSLVSFAAAYPSWEAPPEGTELLARIAAVAGPDGAGSWPAWLVPPGTQRSTLGVLPMYGVLASRYPHLARMLAAQRSTVQQQHAHHGPGSKRGADEAAAGEPLRWLEAGAGRQWSGAAEGSVFGSAELCDSATGLPTTLPLLAGAPEERVLAAQALLQTYYESHHAERLAAAGERGSCIHAEKDGAARPAAPGGQYSSELAALHAS